MHRKSEKPYNLLLSALFLALGVAFPFLTGQIPQIGSMLLPMHIPIFLAGFLCDRRYCVPMAFILPLLRSFLFARPNFYPEAIAIAAELATYAFITSVVYNRLKKRPAAVYLSMAAAMLMGRVVRCLAQMALLGLRGNFLSLSVFFGSVVIAGIPGIIIQLIFIPPIVIFLQAKRSCS